MTVEEVLAGFIAIGLVALISAILMILYYRHQGKKKEPKKMRRLKYHRRLGHPVED